MTLTLSDKGTLLIPVPTESLHLRDVLEIEDTTFVPKTEHHITVFGYRTGRLLLAAFKEDSALRSRIDEHVSKISWSFHRRGFFFVLKRSEPKPLATIIELVLAPVVKLYSDVASSVDSVRWPELAAALGAPPPPHITLYTSDVSGVGGIGLDREEDLTLALTAGSGKLQARILSIFKPSFFKAKGD